MQSLTWYARRLRAMSAREIAWRVQSAVRDRLDRFRISAYIRRAHVAAEQARARGESVRWPRFESGDVGGAVADPDGRAALIERADAILAGNIDMLGGARVFCGHPPDWNRDPAHQVACPRSYAPDIDYRDFRVAGDCKWVWEPARCHHWVVLGRAYRATGDTRYAAGIAQQWTSWLDQCPYAYGMQWRSPLELGIRLINWAWAYALAEPAGVFDDALQQRIWASVALHLDDVRRKYSQGSSANNHLIGEAAGVYIGAVAFGALPVSERLAKEAAEILEREIRAQTLPDGANIERATGYHVFVLQFFTLAGLAARAAGRDFSAEYWSILRKQYEYLAALAAGGPLPMFNDGDDGYVLDLDRNPREGRAWLRFGAGLFGDATLAQDAVDGNELAAWLGHTPSMAREGPSAELRSRAFTGAGVYLLQCGRKGEPDTRMSVAIDCGPLGFGSIAAHGHADALSFTLRCGGWDFLMDPGTYDYFTYPAWRNFLRSTAAHNTLTVDNQDQSELLGLFLWGRRANARALEWSPTDAGGAFTGEHDGYTRLPDPVIHRRRFVLDGNSGTLLIEDELAARGDHAVIQRWHLSPEARVREVRGHQVFLDLPAGYATIEVDTALQLEIQAGGEEGFAGWVSRGYHQRTASTSLICSGSGTGTQRYRTRISYVAGRTGASCAGDSRCGASARMEAATG